MNHPLKLLVTGPSLSDASQVYRGIGPLSYLEKQGLIEIITAKPVVWTDLYRVDAVFLLRPHHPEHYKFATMVKELGLPLWVDHDDLFNKLPKWNPNRKTMNLKEVQSAFRKTIELADVVSFSTENLRNSVKKIAKPKTSYVIQNAIDHYRYRVPPKPNDSDIVTWRGSATHDGDLESQMSTLQWLQKHRRLVMFGDVSQKIRKKLPNATFYTGSSWHAWFKLFRKIKPGIHIIPLVDNEFNRAKSDCAVLEALIAGAPSVCPAWLDGGLGYNHYIKCETIKKAVLALEKNKEYFFKLLRADVLMGRTLFEENPKRKQILEMLRK